MPSDTATPEAETTDPATKGPPVSKIASFFRRVGGAATAAEAAKIAASAQAGKVVGKTVQAAEKTAQEVRNGVVQVAGDVADGVKGAARTVKQAREDAVNGYFEGRGKERPLVSDWDIAALKAPFKAKDDAALGAIVAEAALKGAQKPDGELSEEELNILVAKAKSQAGVTSIKGGGAPAAVGLGLLGGVAASGYGLVKDVGQTNKTSTWKRTAIFTAIGLGLSLLSGGLLLPLVLGGAVLGMMPKAVGFGLGGLIGVPIAVKAFNSLSGKYKDIDGPLRAQLREAAKLGHTHAQERGLKFDTPQRGPDSPSPAGPAPGKGPAGNVEAAAGSSAPPDAGSGPAAQGNAQQIEDAARQVIDTLKNTGHPNVDVAIAYLNQQLTARTLTNKDGSTWEVTSADRLGRAIRIFQRKMELSPHKGENSEAVSAILNDIAAGRTAEAVAGATTLKGKLTANLANLSAPAGRVLSVQEALHTRDVIRQGMVARRAAATHAAEDAAHAHAATPIPIANVVYGAPAGNPIPGYEKIKLNLNMSGMVTGGDVVKPGEETAGLKRQDGQQTAATR